MATLQELLAQKNALEAQIAEETRKGRVEAINQIRSIMSAYNLSANDLSRLGSSLKGTVRPAKYQNPQTGQTWTGQGKRPNWLVEALNKGANISDFLLNKTNSGAFEHPQADQIRATQKSAPPVAKKASSGAARRGPAPKKGRR